MRPRYWFMSYNNGSRSVNGMIRELGGRMLRQGQTAYVYQRGDTLINWGSSAVDRVPREWPILNRPQHVAVATSKWGSFETLRAAGVHVPDFPRSQQEAQEWLSRDFKV